MKKVFALTLVLVLAVALLPSASAQDMPSPTVEVSDQVVLNNHVNVARVYSEGPGFIVIHVQAEGQIGGGAGFKAVHAGWNTNVWVDIDPALATPTMYAMLHVDDGEVGTYEFGTVEGADGPVVVDGAPVTPEFKVELIAANPQFLDGTFTVSNVVTQQDGFIVIHSEQDGKPGPVLGVAPITAGNNANVAVTLEGSTSRVWPMIHVDTGEIGTYEFGTVEGADGPVVINNVVATTPVSTVPTIVMNDQIAVYGDGMDVAMAPVVTAEAVLSQGPGFLVIHQDNEGKPGPVAGVAPVADGFNADVAVELDPALVTPVLWPMLHVDDGEVGTYEFGTVEGADAPVTVDGNVVTFAINAAPSFTVGGGGLSDNHLRIDSVLIDEAGWLVIHSSVNGAPNVPLAIFQLNKGWNRNFDADLDFASVEGASTTEVFPMLHYDTNELGVYEFGTVEGADAPVSVGGNVVVGPVSAQ